MSEANLNVDGVTPLMHNALIAQYDAIVAAVRNCPTSVGKSGGLYVARYALLAALTQHNPRKGAWYLAKAAEALEGMFAQSNMGAPINPLISVPKDAWEDFCRKNGLPLGIYREAIADLQRDANNPRKEAE